MPPDKCLAPSDRTVAPGIAVKWGTSTSGTRFDAFLADLFRHCDACLVSGMDGKFGVRLVRGPAGDEPTLDESNLTEEPAIEVDSEAHLKPETRLSSPYPLRLGHGLWLSAPR